MIRLGIETTDDFISRIHRRANDIVTNIYDDMDVILPDWADIDEPVDSQQQQSVQKYPSTPNNVRQNFPPMFNEKSVLLNTVYADYVYPAFSLYKK